MNTAERLESMAVLVRRGDFALAKEVGNQGVVQIAVDSALIHCHHQLARGTESTVWSGTFLGEPVGIKKAIIGTAADLNRFRREVVALASLADPAIVKLLGARVLPPDYSIITPLYSKSLEARVHEDGWRPSWGAVLMLAARLASALACVHGAGLVHRDIKAGNVLMDAQDRAHLADFGLSELLVNLQGTKVAAAPSGGFHKQRMVGTLQYMAPEVLQNNHHTQMSDIYAWAITVNEVATGTIPFSDCTKDNPACHTVLEMDYGHAELASAVAGEHLRPFLPEGAPPAWAALMQQCWHPVPEQRPTAAQVASTLASLQAALDPVPCFLPAEPMSEPDAVARVRIVVPKAAAAATPQAPEQHRAAGALASAAPCAPWERQHASGYQPAVLAGAYATPGLRGADKMEDRHLLVTSMRTLAGTSATCHLTAVFDGHRGHEAAQHAADTIAAHVTEAWAGSETPAHVLKVAFHACDAGFTAAQDAEWKARVQRMGPAAAGRRRYPGCTALALLQVGSMLVVANAGDCRAVLCSRGAAVQLTRDHTACDAGEQARVVAAGGSVHQAVDTWRVGRAALQVTRSIGDADAKADGVTAQPELTVHTVTCDDEFVVIASDGLWDKLSNEDVVRLVHDTVKDPDMAAKRLVTEALTRGSDDNITAVVVFLAAVGTLESVYRNGALKYALSSQLAEDKAERMRSYATGAAVDETRDGY